MVKTIRLEGAKNGFFSKKNFSERFQRIVILFLYPMHPCGTFPRQVRFKRLIQESCQQVFENSIIRMNQFLNKYHSKASTYLCG